MGLMDKLKQTAGTLRSKAGQHSDQMSGGIDKAAEFIDDKTGGQHRDKIERGADQAKAGLDRVTGGDEGAEQASSETTESAESPASPTSETETGAESSAPTEAPFGTDEDGGSGSGESRR